MNDNKNINKTPWTDEEKQLLIKNYPYMSNKELMVLLNKTDGQLRGMKSKLGLNSKFKPFTQEEKDIIINYYKEHNNSSIDLDELSLLVGRQKTSICRFARKENLTDNCRPLTEETINKMKDGLKKYQETDEYKENVHKQQVELLKYYAKNEHPRGMLGKHHSEDSKKRMSNAHKELAASMSYEEKHAIAMKAIETKLKNNIPYNTTSNAYSRTKGGIRKDLGQYFRSSWEANVARILNYKNIEWEYESKRFYFNDKSEGVLSYQPDFYLPQFNKWIEVKGWMDNKSKIRLKRFSIEYPDENKNLILIDEHFYNNIQKEFKDVIAYWEDGNKIVKELNKAS